MTLNDINLLYKNSTIGQKEECWVRLTRFRKNCSTTI